MPADQLRKKRLIPLPPLAKKTTKSGADFYIGRMTNLDAIRHRRGVLKPRRFCRRLAARHA